MDLRELPVIGNIMQTLSDYATQGLLQRAGVYFVTFVVSAILAGYIVSAMQWYDMVGTGGTLLLAMAILGLFMFGIDPENEYTKEDIMAMWIVMATAPAVMMALHAATGAVIPHVASPLVLLSDVPIAPGNDAGSPAASAVASYLLTAVAYGGVLFATMSTKYVLTA